MCHSKELIFEKFDWENNEELKDLLDNDASILRRNILLNKETYLKISDSIIDDYISSHFPFYLKDIDSYRDYRIISEKEMFDIIFSFLNNFDNSLIKVLKNIIRDQRLFVSGLEEQGTFGETCEISILKKNFMFVSGGPNGSCSIRVAASIMHEFGHNLEMNLYHTSGITNNMYNYPFHEVSSQFLEYAFINYLIENNIYKEEAHLYKRIYLTELFYFVFGMNLFSEMQQISKNEYQIDSDFMEAKEKIICDRINYYGFPKITFDKFDNSYLYGIGYLLSLYLYENYQNNPEHFTKEFKNTLLLYPHINSVNAFESLGVTPEILIKGKTLKRVLKGSK